MAVVRDHDRGVAFAVMFVKVGVLLVGDGDGLFRQEFVPADDEGLAGVFGDGKLLLNTSRTSSPTS